MFIFIIIFKQYYRLHGRPYPSVSWLKSELKPEEWISGRLPPRGLSIFEAPASRAATWSRETQIEEEVFLTTHASAIRPAVPIEPLLSSTSTTFPMH